jgi:hypothetical protein
MTTTFGHYLLEPLLNLKAYQSKRVSSYDRTGANRDFITIEPGLALGASSTSGSPFIRRIRFTRAPR